MAVITRRGPGQFRARIRRRGFPEQSNTFPTRQMAEAWARGIETAMAQGHFLGTAEAARTTLGEALDRYLREVTEGKRGSPQEKRRIAWLKTHPLAAKPLASIRGADLAEFRDARLAGLPFELFRELRARGEDPAAYPDRTPVKNNTVRLDLAIISHLYTIARTEWGMEALAPPMKAIRKPQVGKGRDRRLLRPDTSQEGEESLLLRKAEPALRPVVVLALETAMRRGELASLHWDGIDLQRRVVHLVKTKNGDDRDVPLSARAAAELEQLKAKPRRVDGWVFGIPVVAAEFITQAFRRATKAAGITGLTFHDLRHEATSRLFEHGLGVAEVAAITGHKTLGMLKRYTHLRADDLVLKLARPPVAVARESRAPQLTNFRRRPTSRGARARPTRLAG